MLLLACRMHSRNSRPGDVDKVTMHTAQSTETNGAFQQSLTAYPKPTYVIYHSSASAYIDFNTMHAAKCSSRKQLAGVSPARALVHAGYWEPNILKCTCIPL